MNLEKLKEEVKNDLTIDKTEPSSNLIFDNIKSSLNLKFASLSTCFKIILFILKISCSFPPIIISTGRE